MIRSRRASISMKQARTLSSTRIPILPFTYDAGRAFRAVVSVSVK
jgi:hypothetical protein